MTTLRGSPAQNSGEFCYIIALGQLLNYLEMTTLDQKKVSSSAVKEILPKHWITRSYRQGDEHEILDLWRRVFQQERSLDHWYWKFKNNPYLGAHAALACTNDEGKIVGHYSGIPIKLNFKGDPVQVCQCSDLVIDPDFRGQGMFLETARYSHNEFRESGARMVFAFLSPTSYPGHLRYLNWKPITHLDHYWHRLNLFYSQRRSFPWLIFSRIINLFYNTILQSKLFLERFRLKHFSINMVFHLSDNLTFHHSKTVPDGYDELWQAIKPYEILSMWKDSEYFKWRYEQNPDREFNYFYLVKDDAIMGIAVVNAEVGGYVTICELLVRHRNVINARLLINRILSTYSGGEYKKIRFVGKDVGFFKETFATFRSEVWFGIVLCGEVFDNEELEAYVTNSSYWTLTYGDIDLI